MTRLTATTAAIYSVGLSLLALGCLVAPPAHAEKTTPSPRREFRAAWIATVANIDWPSKPGLSTEQQKQELIAMLDCAVELKLNAVVFQVRPHCDALYESKLEPWSEYLTGTMGEAPSPAYDPLQFAVEEAHKRGIELHAWFNPYRASHPSGKSELSADHISKTNPQAVVKYGKYLWLDPGAEAAVEHSLAVILDVVTRYDIDGVHFDDYFYPYPVNDDDGKRIDFPDTASWEASNPSEHKLSRNDWRRRNVDTLVSRVASEINQVKPHVKFGISPFGIWRPGYPKSIVGFDAYENLYADSLKWFREGDVDYLTPQLYWKMSSSGQSYPALLHWWHEQNKHNRHLWPGNYTSRLFDTGEKAWPADEITGQVWATRAQAGASGNVHFSMKALARNSGGIADQLKDGPYHEPALVPESPWLADSTAAPATPSVSAEQREKGAVIQFATGHEQNPWLWSVSAKYGPHWKLKVIPGRQQEHVFADSIIQDGKTHKLESVGVSAIDRIGRQSDTSTTVYSSH